METILNDPALKAAHEEAVDKAVKAAVDKAVKEAQEHKAVAVKAARLLGQREAERWACVLDALWLLSERHAFKLHSARRITQSLREPPHPRPVVC